MAYRRPRQLVLSTTLALALTCAPITAAAPRMPQDDKEILQRLPRNMFGVQSGLRAQRDALARDPANLSLATQLARRYLEIGRAESDPRYFGYAQAALGPWWTLASPPAEVLLLRGILRQQRHDFDGALADLGALLQQDPRNAQALLTRAGLFQLRGDTVQALRHCIALQQQGQHRFVATACLCNSLSLSGQASKAHLLLRELLEHNPDAPDSDRRWAWTLLAEMTQRLGQHDEAGAYFQRALMLVPSDNYLLMSYAEFLLDTGQAARVRTLLADHTDADSLLLRLAIAEQKLGLNTAAHIATLRARFEASRQRGEVAHRGEEARLHLHLLQQPDQALSLAISNWESQREPRDARILLESALAARDAAAAAPALALIERDRWEDLRLAQLASDLNKLR